MKIDEEFHTERDRYYYLRGYNDGFLEGQRYGMEAIKKIKELYTEPLIREVENQFQE